MKMSAMLLSLFLLGACTGTAPGFPEVMDRYVGGPFEDFLQFSGYTPTGEEPGPDGGTLYHFDDSEMYAGLSGVENVHDCRFTVFTDASGIIRRWESRGDDCRV